MSVQLLRQECEQQIERASKLAGRADGMGAAGLHKSVLELRDKLIALRQDAEKPARVGFIGAFSSGKTRLLEVLLGCAGQLNVAVTASTGNIAAFELAVSDSDDEQTILGPWRVQFMSIGEVRNLLRRLLIRARNQQNIDKVDNPDIRDLDPLLTRAEFGVDEIPQLQNVQDWAVKAYATGRSGKLKIIAFEIYRLVYSAREGEDWLDRKFEVTRDQGINLLTIDYEFEKVEKEQDLKPWRKPIPKVPGGGSLLSIDPAGLFPLVRRVEVVAKLPRAIAQPFDGIALRLVDCPGSGARVSGFRDVELCAIELGEVDAIFALLDARIPGQAREGVDALLNIWKAGGKARILAVVSRFDQFEHDQNASKGSLDGLAKVQGPLTAAEVFGKIPSLDSLYREARRIVMNEDANRVVFLSTMAFITERMAAEKRCQRGTRAFYESELGVTDWDTPSASGAYKWTGEMKQWGLVAARLQQAPDKDSHDLAAVLEPFSKDGGIFRLYAILRAHLRENADSHVLERLKRELDRILTPLNEGEERVRKLEEEKSAPLDLPEGAPPEMSRGELIRALANAFSNLKRKVEGRSFALVRRPAGRDYAVPVKDAIEQWAICKVFEWPQWELLFKRINPDQEPGLIRPVDPGELPAQTLHEQDEDEDAAIPVKSDDFKEQFITTLREVQMEFLARCRDAVRYNGNELLRELEEQPGWLTAVEAVTTPAGTNKQRHSENVRQALNFVETLVSTVRLDIALPSLDTTYSESFGTAASKYFPLQVPSSRSKPLYYFWYKPLFDLHPGTFGDRHRHIMYVVRLRQVLIEAVIVWLNDCVYRVEAKMNDNIPKSVGLIATALRKEAGVIHGTTRPTGRPGEE